MTLKDELKAAVLQLKSNSDLTFERLALEVFNYQANKNPIYKAYLNNLQINPKKINRLDKIPCLPISFFKSQKVITGEISTQKVFESSGTTGAETSKHFVADLPFYESICQKNFERIYGELTQYHILALLPSYLERNNSSLVYMVQSFIYKSHSTKSGFFMKNYKDLEEALKKCLKGNRKILILGVTFALLDFAEQESILKNHADRIVIMETGGMKGQRKEMLREEVHLELKKAFNQDQIHSEYGMTELFSQAYAPKNGWFTPAPSMKIILREVNDPFAIIPESPLGLTTKRRTAGINIIDLANIDSCCFIETQDLGTYSQDFKQFYINGRFDNSDIRGCNLLSL